MTGGLVRQALSPHPLGRLDPPPPGALTGRTALVLNGTAALRASVADAVRALGGEVRDDAGAPVDVVVDLALCGTGGEDWRTAMRRTVEALRAVYGDWAGEAVAGRLRYLAVTSLGGTMGLADHPDALPLSGAWAGLAKTLPREFPVCAVRVVDLGPVGDPGEALVAELLADGPLEVGVRGDRRWTILPRAADADGAEIAVAPTDVLLITGGGRGIGFEFALDVARRTGCEVVVSGRGALPGPEEGWAAADDGRFEELVKAAYRDRADPLPVVRARVRRMRETREVVANLARARAVGARVRYEVCDVTDAASVSALVASAGPRLAFVVHNAGVDAPTRLANKTPEQVLDVIAVKVDGFSHVLAALGDRPLKALCAVGSLTGRYGGMVGQVDYAAANEGLARLAMWAGHRLPYPVKSLSWPTWDGLGLITNLEAAARYMRPISVEAGLAAWRSELTRAGSGEIGFLSDIGAVTPGQLAGLVVPSDWENRASLLTRRFLLGTVTAHEPGRLFDTAHRLGAGWAAFLDDVRTGGAPGVPVSVALEYLLAGAEWLAPPIGPVAVAAAEDLWAWPAGLAVPHGSCVLGRRARVVGTSDRWRVRVELLRAGQPVAGAVVVFGPRPEPRWSPAPAASPRRSAAGYRWRPYAVDVGPWRAGDGGWTTSVRPSRPADLVVRTDPPEFRLPVGHLEAALAVSRAREGAARWRADRLDLHGEGPGAAARDVTASGDDYLVTGDGGVPLISVSGSRWVPA
ncbi:SDR family NAD(P)-dependent oxidoreductase [Saccharothrix xinjiangensis]|uniref:SDR family NAD(P)-dependent oxidoreductase n=1 Tax=Saccharothrix xinjiangensis TaxID=204798 RepID=A0ABV9Y9Z8_9PSEU